VQNLDGSVTGTDTGQFEQRFGAVGAAYALVDFRLANFR
jgi:hypothetical protein